MRILIILSPTNKYGTKAEYTKLRKFLVNDGYLRIATDVFERITTDRKSVQKHIRRIGKYKPSTGVVRIIQLTEKQYNNIISIDNTNDKQEKLVGNQCNVFL